MSTESGRPSKVRASDAEREQYAAVVREAVGEGRLNLDEGDERLATIYASKYRDELRPLVADLPREEDQRYGRGRGDWGRAREGVREGQGDRHWGGREWGGREWGERRWGDPRRRFGRHFGFVAFVAVVLVTIWVATGAHFFWPAIPLAFLFIGLIRHSMWLRWYGQRRR